MHNSDVHICNDRKKKERKKKTELKMHIFIVFTGKCLLITKMHPFNTVKCMQSIASLVELIGNEK